MIEDKQLALIETLINNGETFVLNLTAAWCSDCTDQGENLPLLCDALAMPCYSMVVQQEKNIYLSAQHQAFTEQLGGHGFPRTILVVKGKVVDADNVEVISASQLTALAEQFKRQLA
ncbi:periplasmic thioredoxin of cytochrome c-type biogenesis [Psychromonas sp. psych-6C06]|uniref:periplasmic thioredoxin of cytochrome c-type biogenesis n=1 Tax=Psychromonas sp. psych-6C06 TaxID=2058089 RepID=UPI000C32DD89|nr:periplasmic thioredoxin of cytochrome c-type biogenesis [Psychromonas sp. psych-6C06]PKF60831.1 periplasmic thioredoxin of cytochrome c-type biogenesis [Psychromonas sp. psych-6C06]